MKRLLALLLILVPSASLADDWVHYNNASYGYEFDIPPGYVARAETATEDGQLFQGDTSDIAVSAGLMTARDFGAQAAAQLQAEIDSGWGLVFQQSTPQGASFGTKLGDRRMWSALIPVCDGRAFAQVTVTYGSTDAVTMQRPVSRMERSLRATETCSAI